MIKKIKCFYKDKVKSCFKYDYLALQDKKIKLEQDVDLLEKYINDLNKQIKSTTNIRHLFALSSSIVVENVYRTYKISTLKDPCELDPDSCNEDCCELYHSVQKLESKIRDIKNRLKQYKDCIEFLDELNEKGNTNEDEIYIKINFDSDDNLTCVLFDLGTFNHSDMKLMTLYLSYGKVSNFEKSKMFLDYYPNNGSLRITEFFSFKKRLGHGSFMLQSCKEIVSIMNSIIKEHNRNSFQNLKANNAGITWDQFKLKHNYIKEIRYIDGSISPAHGLTVEDLVRFYDRNGFIKDGKLHYDL